MTLNIHIDKQKSVPVYLQIKEQLCDFIREKNLPPDTLLPSVKEIAVRSGVSQRTADQALLALIEDGICYRRPKKGTFVQDRDKAAPRPICGIWSKYDPQSSYENLVLSELQRGISAASRERGVDASLVFDNPENTIRLYDGVETFDFRGLIIPEFSCFKTALELAARFPAKKFVFLNYRMKGFAEAPPNVYAVVNDDFGGAYRMAESYIAAGCRSMAVVNWKLPDPNDMTYWERVRGFRQAAADYGLDFDPALDLLEGSDPLSTRQSMISYLEVRKYLRGGRRPAVILAVNDILAEGVKRCLTDEELNGEIQLAGYDCLNQEVALNNGFSSVAVQYSAMGRAGIDLLCSPNNDLPRLTKIEPQLHIIKQ